MTRPQFPDPLGLREVQRPGATAHKAGADPQRRLDALEQGAAYRAGGGALYTSTAETTTSASYTTLTTPDRVEVNRLGTNGILWVLFKSQWKISAASGTQAAAIFLDGTQLQYGRKNNTPAVAELAQTLVTTYSHMGTAVNSTATTASTGMSAALATTLSTADVSDVTTGQTFVAADTIGNHYTGAAIPIFGLPAGDYTVEIRYKTSANTLTVRERRLWAWAQNFPAS